MDIHKDCYSAIGLTQQDGPDRRETIVTAKMNGVDPQAWLTEILPHRRPSSASARRTTAMELDAGISDSCASGVICELMTLRDD
jgi:hypothetical protein